MKRIFLWVATNIAVIAVITVILNVLGINQRIGSQNMMALLIMSAVIGFAGSIISLMMSKTMAKHGMGVQVIENPRSETEAWLVAVVQEQAQKAGIGMPEVGIFESAEPNAFATGANRNSALVAVSTGLLRNMNRDEVEAVLGHEVSHVANGDMVTMALLQGVVNTFVVFLSRLLADLFAKDENGNVNYMKYMAISMVFQIGFGFLASLITMWYSRQREYRADAGGADLASNTKMIRALEALQRQHEPQDLPGQLAAFGISGKKASELFMTHPPLEKRIAALKAAQS